MSRGELLVNKEAIDPMQFNKTRVRLAVEAMICTKKLSVRDCVYRLGPSVRADVMAATRLVGVQFPLTVSMTHKDNGAPQDDATQDAATINLLLPDSIVDKPKTVAEAHSQYTLSVGMELHRALSACQTHVAICTCGLLTKKSASALAAKVAADAERVGDIEGGVGAVRRSVPTCKD